MKSEKPILSLEERRAIVDTKMKREEVQQRLEAFPSAVLNGKSCDDIIWMMEEFKEKHKEFSRLKITLGELRGYGVHKIFIYGIRLETDEELELRKQRALQTKSKAEKRAEEIRDRELAELARLQAKYGDTQ